MKLKVYKSELQVKLQSIQGIAESKGTMPILNHFLLEVTKEGASITATDLCVTVRLPLNFIEAVTGGADMSLCIPAKKMFEIIKEADSEVTLESEDGKILIVKSGKSRFKVACLSASEFPKFPDPQKGVGISIKTSDLLELIDKSLYAAGEQDTRYTLNGLLFDMKPDNLTVVGTDGHRLGIIKKQMAGIAGENEKAIVPRKAVAEIKKFLGNAETVSMVFEKNHVLFKIADILFLARLIDGSYPDYEKVIPVSNDKSIILNREAFLKALRRVALMSKEGSNAIKINMSKDLIVLSASNADIGDASDEVIVEYSGDDAEIGFNVRYLLDAVNAMTDEGIVFSFKDSLSPALLTEKSNGDCKAVVMPMRIN